MRLLQFSYSPFAAKVRVCLKLKKLDCELVEIPYTQRSELVKVSGGVGVPVLVDGQTVVTDSLGEDPGARAGALVRSARSVVGTEQWTASRIHRGFLMLSKV